MVHLFSVSTQPPVVFVNACQRWYLRKVDGNQIVQSMFCLLYIMYVNPTHPIEGHF
jgi:hypothetical protein